PASVAFLSATSSQGSCANAGGTVTCNLGTVPVAGSVLVRIGVAPSTPGRVTNSVSVGTSSLDLVASNNLAVGVTDVQLPPLILTPPQDQTVTNGATVTFTATVSGTPPLAFQWQFNGVDLSGAINPSLTLSNVSLASAGSYRLRVTNNVGTASSAAALLTVVVSPVNHPPTIS